MHEAGLVRDVLERADRAARDGGGKLQGLLLHVGVASGIEVDAVRRHAELAAEALWGYRPGIEIRVGTDPLEPGAHGLSLVSVRVEEP